MGPFVVEGDILALAYGLHPNAKKDAIY